MHERFPGVIWQNLSAPGAGERLVWMSDKEMFRLAIAYTAANHGDAYELVGVIRDPQQRARYLKAAQEVAPRPERPDRGGMRRMALRQVIASGPLPNVGMTLEEIYLEFRTAQLGSLGVEAALYETATFAGYNLGVAWATGQTVGYGVSFLLQTYAPAQMDALVGQNMLLLIDGSSAFVPDQWTALLLVQDGSGYGLGDFGVMSDIAAGPALPWESPTLLPADPGSGWNPTPLPGTEQPVGPPQQQGTPTITIEPAPSPPIEVPSPDLGGEIGGGSWDVGSGGGGGAQSVFTENQD